MDYLNKIRSFLSGKPQLNNSIGQSRPNIPSQPVNFQPIINQARPIINRVADTNLISAGLSTLPTTRIIAPFIKPPMVPTVGKYARGQIIQPARTAFNKNASKTDRAIGAAQAAFNLIPSSVGYNIVGGTATGTLETLRNKDYQNLNKNIKKSIANPSSLATEGLGVKNPILAMGIDTLAMSPKSSIKGVKNLPGAIKALKGTDRMLTADIKDASNAIERFRNNSFDIKYMMSDGINDEKTIRGIAEFYIDKKFAQKEPLQNVIQELTNRIMIDRRNIPKMGLSMGLNGKPIVADSSNPIPQVRELRSVFRKAQPIQRADSVSNVATEQSSRLGASIPEQLPPQQITKQSNLLRDTQLKGQLPPSTLPLQDSLRESSNQSLKSIGGQAPINTSGSRSFDSIISEAKKEISDGKPKIDRRTLSEIGDDIYTSWVDRFHPITKLAGKVEKSIGGKGAELRPEANPRYTIKRFLGAGGIAENKFNNEFKPILNEIDNLKIDKGDLDVYLKNRRDVGFGSIGREIKGSDAVKAQNVVSAIEGKYGEPIKGIADKIYSYQNKMFDELVKAGFIDHENAKLIRTQNPDYVPFFRDMESQIENYLGLPSNKLQQGKNPISKIEGSNKKVLSPVESVIANTFKYRAAIEKNNVARSIVGLQNAMPELGFKKVSQTGADTITVWENGKKSFYQVGNDIAETVKGLNEEQMNSVLKVLSIPSTWLRQGATGRNPDFILPNLVRDQMDAALNSKYGYVPFVDWARGLAHMYKKDDIYQKFQQSGAQIKLSDLAGRKGVQELFNEKTNKKIVPKLINFVTGSLDKLGSISEQPTRVGLFAKAYKKTGNELLANMESREGTLDFARMGSKMKVANSLIPFLNVGIQGFDKMARTAKSNPAKFAVKMGIYGATPTLLTTLYNVTAHPEEYKEIPQWVKNSNFVIVTGRNDDGTVDYFTVPKGNVIQYISNPIENFVSYMADTDSQTVKEMALQFLSSSAPVIGDGGSLSEIGLKTVGQNLPQAIKPTTENLMNKSFYKFDSKKGESKAIVPTYLQNKADGDQSYEFTPSAYKTLGKALNISPLKVQNFLEGHFAGGAKIPVALYETAKAIIDGDPYDRNKTPILRRFIQQTYPTSETKSTGTTGVKRELAKAPESSMLAGAEAAGFSNPFKKKKQEPTKETGKISEISWESEAGRKTTVNLGEDPKKKLSGIDAFNKENPTLKKARQVYGAPSDQVSAKDKAEIYKQLGYTREELDYDHKSSGTFNTDERVAYIKSKKLNHDQLLNSLTSGRKESVGGNMFATDQVVEAFVKNGELTKAEAKAIKAIDNNKSKEVKVGRKAKKLKVKFSAVKPPKIGSSRSRKSVFKAPKVAKPKVEKIVFKKKKKTSL